MKPPLEFTNLIADLRYRAKNEREKGLAAIAAADAFDESARLLERRWADVGSIHSVVGDDGTHEGVVGAKP